jgi:hypothetical protein
VRLGRRDNLGLFDLLGRSRALTSVDNYSSSRSWNEKSENMF